jgi:hypothetical protein
MFLVNHPGPWQSYLNRPDNKELSLMEVRDKYMQEQLLFENYMSFQHQQQMMMANASAGGGPLPTPEPTPNPSSQGIALTSIYPTSGDACLQLGLGNVNDPGGYIYLDATVEEGTAIYDDINLLTPKAAGWYGYPGTGVALLLDNDGIITGIVGCA